MSELENLHQPYGETWHFRRRVPYHVRKYDKRSEIKCSLKTKDLKVAIHKRDLINHELNKIWDTLLLEADALKDPIAEYNEALDICKKLGIKYIKNDELLKKDVSEIVHRLELVEEHFKADPIAKAALGLVEIPKLVLQDAYDLHLAVQKKHLLGKSDDFIRKWENPRKRAINNFTKACGKPDIEEIDFAMALKFRDWWLDRIENEKLSESTANKDMTHLWSIIRDASKVKKIDLSNPFKNCKLSDDTEKRPSFTNESIFKLIKFKGLMTEHPSFRELIIGMAEQGCRDSEIIGLDPDADVILTDNIPHINVRPNQYRSLKNKPSKRKLPLVGYALEIARETGFKNLELYRHSPDKASSTINKYLRKNGLFPTDKHSLYSFRHSFKDRLDAVEAPEKIIKDLMGHTPGRVNYGEGTSLDHRSTWMEKISLKEMAKTIS
jgi:hypothetical protein